MAGSLEDGMPVSLPDDLEFFEAISDCSNVVIRAAGGQMSAYSSILLEQSPVFRAKLSKFTAGIPDSDLVVEVRFRHLGIPSHLTSLIPQCIAHLNTQGVRQGQIWWVPLLETRPLACT